MFERCNMKPKCIPERAWKWIQELFRWFQALQQDCSFHLHAYSSYVAFFSPHFPFIILQCFFHLYLFLFISYHFHSNLLSRPCIFLSFACIFLCFAFMSFHLHSKGHGSMAWPGDRVQQMLIAKLSLRLSQKRPRTFEHMILFEGNLPEKRQSERERARNREREERENKKDKKRERKSERES